MNIKTLSMTIALAMLISIAFIFNSNKKTIPVIAIANYGPHSSLSASIQGFKKYLHEHGYIEGKNVQYTTADVGFDQALISQMLAALSAKNPKLMLLMTTPVAMTGKATIHNTPLIYSTITDPVSAGLIPDIHKPDANLTGSSDMQDLKAFLIFAKSLLPTAKKIGLMYATAESNDLALVKMMQDAAGQLGMQVMTIPIESSRDIAIRVTKFKNQVDFIYVGASGPIQPALPAISASAKKMHIPVFNAEKQAVIDGLALASLGVDYQAVGKNAGKLAVALLQGESVNKLTPIYPSKSDHKAVINRKLAHELAINLPSKQHNQQIEFVG